MQERTDQPQDQPTPTNDGTPTNDPAAALHWAAVALGLAEARTEQGNPLTDEERGHFNEYQAAAHTHGYTDEQIRCYLQTELRQGVAR